jgi:hypothetical protein
VHPQNAEMSVCGTQRTSALSCLASASRFYRVRRLESRPQSVSEHRHQHAGPHRLYRLPGRARRDLHLIALHHIMHKMSAEAAAEGEAN